MARPRKPHELRPVSIESFPSAAAGSVIITQGETRVLCTASVSAEVPAFLIDKQTGQPRSGWITAEYAMLPGSTRDRKKRGPDGRATEIQRLIGRVLRAAIDLKKMPGVAITCDCDVLCADGGTRTASITGAWVALALAVQQLKQCNAVAKDPLLDHVAAISVGRKPTFDSDHRFVEAYFVGVDREASGAISGLPEYGWPVRLSFDSFIREQARFGSAGALVSQIERDVERVCDMLGRDHAITGVSEPVGAAS